MFPANIITDEPEKENKQLDDICSIPDFRPGFLTYGNEACESLIQQVPVSNKIFLPIQVFSKEIHYFLITFIRKNDLPR